MSRAPHNLRPQARRGFTLIELVLALMMVAILAGGLYASLRVAFDAQATAAAAIEPGRTADLAFEFIRDDFQNVMPPHDPSTYTSQYQYLAGSFEGTTGGATGNDADVTFFSTSSMKQHPSSDGEIKEIELTTDRVNGSTKKSLVRKCARNLTVEISPPPSDEEVLCRDVDSFSVQYFDGSNWNDYWDSTQTTPNELPAAVQVTIVLDRTPPGTYQKKLIKFTRTFQLSISTAVQDADVTSGLP